jgi:uncharacterized protein with FMN-binding domain
MAKRNAKFTAAVKKAKGLYRTGKYKTFGAAVKAAYGKNKTVKTKPVRRKKISAVKLIERGENKRTKAKRTVRVSRTRKGTYKKFSTVSGTYDYNYVVLQKITSANNSLGEAEKRLDGLKNSYRGMPKGIGKGVMKRNIKNQQRLVAQIRKEVRGFKSLLK